MNDNERMLLRAVCDNDLRKAQAYARTILLNNMTAKKDEEFKRHLLDKLNAKRDFIQLPYNLQGVLVAEDCSNFPINRVLIRSTERECAEKVIDTYYVAEKLLELGIHYLPSLLLFGASGTGKTMLARYIAYKVKLPFLYVRFASLIDSLLGKTSSKIAQIFSFVKESPCVLCFDEIDAIGQARGTSQDVGEMNRIVISLMQELDNVSNENIVIGTTNRFDQLDPALSRRFVANHEVKPFTFDESVQVAKLFFSSTDIPEEKWWPDIKPRIPCIGCTAAQVSNICKDWIVNYLTAQRHQSA